MKKDLQIYLSNHNSFFDKILIKKRLEILNILNFYLKDQIFEDVLDIGTTNDLNKSSNFIIKNLKNIKSYKCISNQRINSNLFSKILTKSITKDLSEKEIADFKSDLVISNATIEHVGSLDNQIKMCENMIKLSKKYFVIITPNRFHPIEFHTKLPFIHWFNKNLHRKILKTLKLNFFSKEENLNLLSQSDLVLIMKKINFDKYEIKKIKFLNFTSNMILIGSKSS